MSDSIGGLFEALMAALGERELPTRLVGKVGSQAADAVIANEVRKRYKPETSLNDNDGFYAAVVMCRYCEPNHEVMKSAWIFDTEDEAKEYAESMVESLVDEAIGGANGKS